MLRGLYPWWHWLLERENPRTLRAAPILAGIITAAIVGWWRNRK
ncbi:type I toxin-antitoxin system toxin Ldr family protein [Escherichia coli]|nr:type I toxin-antitoxin system toxin Ldr family protein [Escherichia coli]MDS1834375.1 type I toxin-antitoxin system toxin Ldr family protein [Escherichia coli]